MKKTTFALALALALAAAASVAHAQTLYKLIDKNGKVTYSESVPKDFPGQVIRIDVNPEANRATLPKFEPGAAPATGGESRASPVAAARDKVEAAKKALQQARDNPSEDEVQRVGTVKGFARPVETDAYKAKLAKLEQDVKDAEEELRRAEGR